MKNIAIFASGNGTNAERIANYFTSNPEIQVQLILTNNPAAGVLEKAERLRILTIIFDRNTFYYSDEIIDSLTENKIDLIVLAGFLWLVPGNILKKYANRIVNIHPALLPNYGGKGMYGQRVHQTVIANGDVKSGISIHFVNEKYDEGSIIFQAEVKIEKGETPDSLAAKIHQLEHKHFPVVIEKIMNEIE